MSKEAMKLALEALEAATRYGAGGFEDAKDALREALAEQPAQQEPVRFKCTVIDNAHPKGIPLEQWVKPQPAQRTWVGLTDSERGKVYADWRWSDGRTSNLALCEAIEAKLKEKNT